MATRTARVDLPTDVQAMPDTLSLASGMAVQLCPTSVQVDDQPSRRISLLLAGRGPAMPTEADLESALTEAPSLGIVAGLISPDSGSASVTTLPRFVDASKDLALAAAVCAASWGWDESERIHVTVNGREWSVTPRFRAGAWRATID